MENRNTSIFKTDLIKPDAFYWPGYLWFWNDRLVENEIFSRLGDMNSVGAKSLWIIPVPGDFRPDSMPTDMEPDYLSKEYLELFSRMVGEMKRLDMRLWLYDEGGWPSGGVCGRIVRKNPRLAQQTLRRIEIKPGYGDVVKLNPGYLSGFLFKGGTLIRRLGQDAEIVADTGDIRVGTIRYKI